MGRIISGNLICLQVFGWIRLGYHWNFEITYGIRINFFLLSLLWLGLGDGLGTCFLLLIRKG